MHLAKVIAKVVATQKAEKLVGGKLLVIKSVDEYRNLMDHEPPYVALDCVGAGVGDCVLVDWGGSVDNDPRMVSDMSIVGIIDTIEFE
ncbi:EutN/CcmL family microcompartment protein [Propionispora vibrioides]|uniref:Ethanolamine utilization protein EutN n=1 Tax=Propionispora vibrioides TaxID=112903 RepID=A0A1H8XT72_9FIRM|nr:EutN/CcmL family microcompartment protein [Propionispora vibrioides]SEP43029.1 ethanolamine utilization protein EutN [Propionispora vibrioides]